MSSDFLTSLTAKLRECSDFALYPRRDFLRYPAVSQSWTKIVELASAFGRRTGIIPNGPKGPQLFQGLQEIIERLDDYQRTYTRFQDDASRALFVELLAFRLLGPKFVRLSIDTKQYWDQYYSIDPTYLRARNAGVHGAWRFNEYRIRGKSAELNLICHQLNILSTFVLQQYRLARPGFLVEPRSGQTVIDGGACYGDTALWFADQIGDTGQVFAFECDPANRKITVANFARNAELAGRIDLQTAALWGQPNVELHLDSAGPGSVVRSSANSSANTVTTASIDDFVVRKGNPQIGFIKMDIEGAELPALAGARETLVRNRPDLAIAAYHLPHDIVDISDFLLQLQVGYRIALGHFTNHAEETIVFATVRPASEQA